MELPLGFRFGSAACGIKSAGDDLALVVSDVRATAAGCVTQSRTRAPSVDWLASRLPSAAARAIIVNSGNANCLTGARGDADNRAMASAVAMALDVPVDAVLTCSTGVIGVPLPIEKITPVVPTLCRDAGPEPEGFARAILTTDLRTKMDRRVVGGSTSRMVGVAKGSGMIHPNMATMLAFILTDASVSPAALATLLRRAVDETFNMITVDGDTSTNDAVLALANGLGGEPCIDDPESAQGRALYVTLRDCCAALAKEIVRDGEGARRLVTARVVGAQTSAAARRVARAVVSSSLVKTAVFGADPNWGRVLAAVGQAAAEHELSLRVDAIRLALQGVSVFEGGAPLAFDAPDLHRRLDSDHVDIDLELGEGAGVATAWGCDLSADYVRINADYHAST